jgi:hypothetical protein
MTTHYDYTDRSGRMFRRFTDMNGKPMGTQYLGMAETAHQEISSSAGGSSSIADRLRVIAAEIEQAIRDRDAARLDYCRDAFYLVGDEDEQRQLTPQEIARRKGWPWPIPGSEVAR